MSDEWIILAQLFCGYGTEELDGNRPVAQIGVSLDDDNGQYQSLRVMAGKGAVVRHHFHNGDLLNLRRIAFFEPNEGFAIPQPPGDFLAARRRTTLLHLKLPP